TMDMYELITLHAIAQRLIESSDESKRGTLDNTKKIETCSKGDFSDQIIVFDVDCRFPGGTHSLSGRLSPGMPIIPRPTEMRLQAPASFQQATMYTGEHLVAPQAHSDYNVLIQFGAIGKLDVEALKMALAFLWRRHQVFRTALILQVSRFPGLFYMTVTNV
ncbi:MAG: hypothetical protein GY789_11835, partial [Hyphomicrobiales bacterium]|nr:hypothetical protein [Hyphomicrobiales bacterium]